MKQFYYSLLLLGFSFFVTAQTATTGNSTEVGVTEGQLSVSLSGAATYTIPIAVPPGINGVVPQIGLAYNSQGGNGMAGYGWNISGVSMITRIPSTKYHDGTTDPVDFYKLEKFALDGQRLIVKKIGGPGEGTEYETENYSNLKITFYSEFYQAGPDKLDLSPTDYFIVQYPDGSSAKYEKHGSYSDWTISYWENPQSVFISYEYTAENNNSFISKIKYGSVRSANQINEIQFVYKSRQRQEQGYVGGLSFMNTKMLSAINVKGSNTGFRSYSLEHDTSSLGYERLTSITEKSGDGTKNYNPTVFTYNENISTTGITSLTPLYLQTGLNKWFSEASPPKIINGDFDGDGDLDFMANSVMYTKVFDDGSIPIKFDLSSTPVRDLYASVIKCLEDNQQGYKLMTRDALCTIPYSSSADILEFNIYSKDLINNSMKFEYSKKIEFPSASSSSSTTFDGDFNGDGLTDKIVIKNIINSEADLDNLHNVNLYFVNLDRRITSNYVKDLGIIPNVNLGKQNKLIKTADVNGDGKTDLIFFNGGTINSISVYSLDSNNDLIKLWETPFAFIHKTYQNNDNILFEHINGTGYHPVWVYQDGVPTFGYYDVDPIDYQYIPIIGDFNGDGKSDIILSGLERTTLFSTGFSFVTESLPTNFPASHDIAKLVANDFNNDGKTDILSIKHNHNKNLQPINEVVLTMSHLSWISKSNWAIDESSFPNLNANFFRYGVNPIMIKPSKLFKDKPEILLYEAEPSFGSKDSQGNDVTLIKAYKIGFFVKQDAFTNSVKLIKTITTGNGVKETITYSPLMNGNSVYTAADQVANYPNIDIVNASNFQVVSKLEKQSSTVYKKQLFSYYGAVSNLEGLGFLGFQSTVRTNWHNDSNPIVSSISKFDIEERGANIENYTVLGWHEPLISNGNEKANKIIKQGSYTITGSENLIATQSIVLKPDSWIQSGSNFTAKIVPEANKSINTPTDFITKSILTYESELLPNKVFKIQNTISKQYNALENTSSETTTVYDTYNNPTQSTILLKEGGQTVQTTVSNIEYDNQPTGSTYYIGRPTNKKQTVEVPGDRMVTEEQYAYTNHLLSQIKKKSNSSDFITEDNIYDAFGNITTKTITAVGPGLDPRITSYEYDASHRFLVKSTDVEKLATIYDYNQSNGVLNFETNPFGLKTTYEYDSWFKKIKTIDYLGQNNTYVYTKDGNVNTLVTTTGSDGSVSEQLFDDLGRKIASGVKDINGSISNISYEYDIYDRNFKVSEPYYYFISQNNVTEYDVYGRATKNTLFTGKTVSIQYTPSSLISNVTEDSKTKIITKNAMGKVISMNDSSGGTINYTYFANGNLKETNYDGVKTTVTQDDWGRKKSLDDPSAGTYGYSYNGFGETLTETTPNGTTSYILDSTGKVKNKKIKNIAGVDISTTDYTYDSGTKLLTNTLFKDDVEGNEISTTYAYDAQKRISSTTEVTPYATFVKGFTYDAFGRVLNETSNASANGKKSDKTMQHTYKYGQAWQIIDTYNSQVLWQTNTVNQRGQLRTATLGNGLTITKNYDEYGCIKNIQSDSGSTNIMNYETTFDVARGNLLSRNNSFFGPQETFGYDLQDRLTTIVTSKSLLNSAFSTSNSEGFLAEGGATVNTSSGQLVTQASASGSGVKKTFMGGAKGGDIVTVSFNLNKVLGTDTFNIYIQEENPSTGTVVKYLKKAVVSGINTFAHTVAQNSTLVLKIEKANTTGLNVFLLDNVVATLSITKNQEYDGRGRITKNDSGDYNYKDPNSQKVYRNTSITLSTEASDYYKSRGVAVYPEPTTVRQLNISYNTFKCPIQIDETGVDKISFTYNDNNDRSAMFYGGLQSDKKQRQYSKYYSADGSMEIKVNNLDPSIVEFVTYIGGDGYTAPLVVKSDGTTQNYLYLHRDYQGSILAITNQEGIVVEKRQFDAWGSIMNVQDGASNTLAGLTVLDRGYTGHEHIQSVGIINMNGRLYDPMLHRFLQPDNNIQDPFNTDNFNRYAYVLNNPLKYTDPSGESLEGIFGFLFSFYVHGASASGGELNPTKWTSTGWTNAFSSVGSVVATTGATTFVNGYMEGYNKPPELGVSASSDTSITNSSVTGSPYVSKPYTWNDFKWDLYLFGNRADSWADSWAPGVGQFIASFHPAVGLLNGYNGYMYGHDIYGQELSKKGATFEVGMAVVPFVKVGKLGIVADEVATKIVGKELSVAERAANLSKRINKNTFIVDDLGDGMKMQYDFLGATHKGVPTPHVQLWKLNINPATGVGNYNKVSKFVLPMTEKHINYLENYFNLMGY